MNMFLSQVAPELKILKKYQNFIFKGGSLEITRFIIFQRVALKSCL